MSDVPPARILEAVSHDKKARAGRVPFILPTAIGRVEVHDDVTRAEIRDALREMARRESASRRSPRP
jgi:3-dehydroquinate synthase